VDDLAPDSRGDISSRDFVSTGVKRGRRLPRQPGTSDRTQRRPGIGRRRGTPGRLRSGGRLRYSDMGRCGKEDQKFYRRNRGASSGKSGLCDNFGKRRRVASLHIGRCPTYRAGRTAHGRSTGACRERCDRRGRADPDRHSVDLARYWLVAWRRNGKLAQLAQAIADRGGDSKEPLSVEGVPREVRPLLTR